LPPGCYATTLIAEIAKNRLDDEPTEPNEDDPDETGSET